MALFLVDFQFQGVSPKETMSSFLPIFFSRGLPKVSTANTIFTVDFNLKLFVRMERKICKVFDVKTQIYFDFVTNFLFSHFQLLTGRDAVAVGL